MLNGSKKKKIYSQFVNIAHTFWKKMDSNYELYSHFANNSVELRKKTIAMVEKTASLDISNRYRREMTAEELINKFDMDEYGSTPPRQRTRIKTRDWDRKQKL